MKPLKPWRTFDDQLTVLQKRGLAVDHASAALAYLERLGYYRLSGYWYPLREMDLAASLAQKQAVRLDQFVSGSRFEDVVRLYVFDKKLRLLALDALERIEMAVRVNVAHTLGQHDPVAHENPACLHGNFTKKKMSYGPDAGKTKHQLWLSKYQALLHRARKEPFVAHHMQQYGTMPIWAAVELWDFGLLSKLFEGMQHADQAHIASIYGAPGGQAFAQWLRSLNFIRNVCAHHSRLWNINVVERSAVPPAWSRQLHNARPFFYFCIMRQLLSVICPRSTWGLRFARLLTEEFPHSSSARLSLDDFGIYAGWADAPPWHTAPEAT